MNEKIYVVTKIEGEYAYLTEEGTREELFIALALLPEGIDINSKLSYTFPDFTLI